MNDLKGLNNNIIANQWKIRYAEQPQEIKDKLDKLSEARAEEYQLQVVKKKKIYPQIGDVFELRPREDIILEGIVINNHINNINGNDLLLVLIFKKGIDIKAALGEVKSEYLLIPPQIVGKEYWTRGYFYNKDYIEKTININNLGFYSIGKGKFYDEYGQEIKSEPKILGTFGVVTISGIARKINQELIISKMI